MYEAKARFFDAQATADWADKEYGSEEAAKLARLLSLLPKVRNAVLLEPGCGTGRLSAFLARAVGPAGAITAMDISAAMTSRARARLAGFPNVEVLTASLEHCPLPEKAYDAAVCHQVFPHLEDKSRALQIMFRALKSGGRLLLTHFINRAQVNDVHRKAGTAVEHDLLPGETEMIDLLESAGFKVLSLKDDDQGYFLTAQR
ncbi:MAG: class I SAM-dependent methyltransferase [Desulfovibrionaceae bacterium]